MDPTTSTARVRISVCRRSKGFTKQQRAILEKIDGFVGTPTENEQELIDELVRRKLVTADNEPAFTFGGDHPPVFPVD